MKHGNTTKLGFEGNEKPKEKTEDLETTTEGGERERKGPG